MRIMDDLVQCTPMLIASHVRRQANKVADYMENAGASIGERKIDDPPSLLARDAFLPSCQSMTTKYMGTHLLSMRIIRNRVEEKEKELWDTFMIIQHAQPDSDNLNFWEPYPGSTYSRQALFEKTLFPSRMEKSPFVKFWLKENKGKFRATT